eukprot:9720186-Alexandrium_andersonii.AAC.1
MSSQRTARPWRTISFRMPEQTSRSSSTDRKFPQPSGLTATPWVSSEVARASSGISGNAPRE